MGRASLVVDLSCAVVLATLPAACTSTLDGNLSGTGGESPGGTGGTAGGGGTTDDAGPSEGGGGSTGGDAGSPLTGQEAFAALCAPCHGAQGQGSPLGPELQHPVAGFSTWVVRNGRATTVYPAPMAVFDAPAINEAQLDEIWAWLDGLPNPTTGQALYDDYCANCHGADALGGRVGKDIEDKQLADVQEKVREGEGGNGYANTTGYMPRWSVGQLSDEELTLIANYIASL